MGAIRRRAGPGYRLRSPPLVSSCRVMSRSRSYCRVAISLLALAAFAVRAASLDAQSLWRDEVDALHFAVAPWPEMLSNFTRPGWNGPFYFLLLRGWVALTGTSEYAMRFSSLAFGVLCVPLVYALGRRLFNRQIGTLAALLVTTSPYLTWYSQEVKMYTLVPALALLAIYGLRRAIEGEGWRWWAVQIVATSLAFYSHILAALLIPVQVLLCLTWWPQTRKQWAGVLVSLACLTLPYLPLADWQARLALQERETGFAHHSLGNMVQILLDGWSMGVFGASSWSGHWSRSLVGVLVEWGRSIVGWCWPWGAVRAVRMDALAAWVLDILNKGWSLNTMLMSTLAVWGLARPLLVPHKEKRGEGRLALACWLMTPLLAVWLISLRQPLFTDRYLIWAAPAFYLLIALGLASLLRFGGWWRWAVVLLVGIILLSNIVNQLQQATIPMKSDFRAAAAYMAGYHTSDEPSVSRPPLRITDEKYAFKCYLPLAITGRRPFDGLIIFQIPHGRYTFNYYFPEEEYPWAEGLYTNHRAPDGSYLMSEQEAAYRMREITAGYDVVWLVVTEMPMWDERGLVQAWLESNALRVDEVHFARVDVYRYLTRKT